MTNNCTDTRWTQASCSGNGRIACGVTRKACSGTLLIDNCSLSEGMFFVWNLQVACTVLWKNRLSCNSRHLFLQHVPFSANATRKHRMPASLCILFKHVSYTISRRCLIHPSPSPLTLFLARHKARDRSPWASRSITAKLSTSSSTRTSTESFTSPYLSVRIRCPKDAAVSFFLLQVLFLVV